MPVEDLGVAGYELAKNCIDGNADQEFPVFIVGGLPPDPCRRPSMTYDEMVIDELRQDAEDEVQLSHFRQELKEIGKILKGSDDEQAPTLTKRRRVKRNKKSKKLSTSGKTSQESFGKENEKNNAQHMSDSDSE